MEGAAVVIAVAATITTIVGVVLALVVLVVEVAKVDQVVADLQDQAHKQVGQSRIIINTK